MFKDLGLTPTIRTGKGWHMWYGADAVFKQNGPVDLTEFEKRDSKKYQLEVYTSKRLDIIPPSKHHSGVVYEWSVPLEDFPDLPKLPDSIAKLCEKKERNNNEYLTESVSEGRRHSVALNWSMRMTRNFPAGTPSRKFSSMAYSFQFLTSRKASVRPLPRSSPLLPSRPQ